MVGTVVYYLRKRLGRAAKRLLGLPTFPPKRYRHLYEEIARVRPRRILEIGTNDGLNAVEMVNVARRSGVREVEYFGFDLFEGMDDKLHRREFALHPRSKREVAALLRRRGVRQAQLFAGDTRETLREAARTLPVMDLVFIDGGHSYETVASDWKGVEPLVGNHTSVFFDDYPSFGVGRAVDEIDRELWEVTIFPTVDRFPSEGADLEVQLARTKRRNGSRTA